MQQKNTPLQFLSTQIMDVKVALFKCEIDSVLSLPNNIIQTLNVDDDGIIYFFTSAKINYAKQISAPFYASLEYHKKGTDNILQVTGKAEILLEEKSEHDVQENDAITNNEKTLVMVKLKIMQAEFIGNCATPNYSFTQKIKNTFQHIFSNTNTQRFNFQRH